jgi:MYXO-CTERM domain-containing protein
MKEERSIMKIRTALIAALAAGSLVSVAAAQTGTGHTLNSNNVRYVQSNSPTSPTPSTSTTSGPSADLFFNVGGSPNPDNAFGSWWYYRFAGDTREFALNSVIPGSRVITGNSLRLGFQLAPGVLATLEIIANGPGVSNNGSVTQSLTIQNTSGSDVELSLFHVMDLDPNGGFSHPVTFSGTVGVNPTFNMTSGPQTIAWTGTLADAYQALPYSPTSVFGLMNNTAVNDLNNTIPTGNFDFTGGFQWNRTIGNNQELTVVSALIGLPTPGAMALLGLGGLAAARRRRA